MDNVAPKIRIFISSTFLDMQKERDILNQDIFPLIKGECDKLGIPFTVIDLRWGITEEDQARGNVVDLCLEEIKHCKPYFIGLVGNRYGWCPDKYDDELEEKYQFIKDNEDKSVTELEMILGAINAENKSRCFFYFKDSKLFEDYTSDHQEKAIEELKERITKSGLNHQDYFTFDEFKEHVIKDLLKAIHEDYPSKDVVPELKQKTFLSLQSSTFVSRVFMMAQVADIIAYGENNHVPVVAYSAEQLGKTMLFNRMIASKENADKIIINLRADKSMQYFPWYYLCLQLTKEFERLGISLYDFEDVPAPTGYLSTESYYQTYLGCLAKNIYELELEKPLYILINDFDLLFDNDASSTFVRHFLCSKEKLPNNLYVFLTSCNKNQLNAGKFNVAEMHENSLENPKQFLSSYLEGFAKKIDQDILDHANPNLKFVDYKYIADYLIYYCNFASYKDTARALLAKNNRDEILLYIYLDCISKLSPKCASVFSEILIRLAVFDPGFSEEMVFASYDKNSAIEELKEHQVYVDLSEIEKAAIMRPLRYFSDVESGVIFISDRGIKQFLKNNINELWKVIASTYQERSEEAANKLFGEVDYVSKYGRQYTKEEYLSLLRENNEMHQEIEYAIFDPLCAYLNKVIMDFANTHLVNDDVFYSSKADDYDFYMLSIIQEAAHLYKINTRGDLFQNLLANKRLMYFIQSRSHSLVRRLVKGYIDLNIDLQKRQYHKVDMDNISFLVNYVFESITSHQEKDEQLQFLQSRIIANIALMMRENDILGGKFEELVDSDYYIDEVFSVFIYANCSEEICNLTSSVDYEVFVNQDVDQALDYYYQTVKGYEENENIYHKIACAYNAFVLAFFLAEQEKMGEKEYAMLSQICQTIEEYLRYCYYPEIFAMFDMFFGRLYPNNILWRIMIGINVLKYQGFNSVFASYQEAYDCFKQN